MEESKGERINKYLAAAGVCSRREADKLVDEGVVTVDGVTALAGTKVFPGQKVAVNGRVIEGKEEQIIIAFNKPAGIVCTTKDAHAEQNIVDYIGFDKRIFPVGRLDKESEGLILLTNDGELSDKRLRSRNEHEKEYEVTVNRPVTESFIKFLSGGVFLEELNVKTKPCKVKKTGPNTFNIILTQGLNRQIRRMCRAGDYHVRKLKRVRIMNIKLGDLPLGKWRELSEEEKRELNGGW